jgi:hypothetical protein
VITTERTYVEGLHTLVTRFADPLRKLSADGAFPAEALDRIFLNVDSILSFHRIFLAELEKEENFCVLGLSIAFLRFADFLKLYTLYINGYPQSSAALTQLQDSNRKFAAFLAKASESRLDMPSLLILPVQRIPRYELLLSELLKKTDEHCEQIDSRRDAAAAAAAVSEQVAARLARARSSGSPTTASMLRRPPGDGLSVGGSPKRSSAPPSPKAGAGSPAGVAQPTESAATPPSVLSMLQMALDHIKQIAATINSGSEGKEALRFFVTKVNSYNRDTPRCVELDIGRRLVCVCKQKDGDPPGQFSNRDWLIPASRMASVKLSDSDPTKAHFSFFPSEARLLRSQKHWRFRFATTADRERFYRLMQVHILPRSRQRTASAVGGLLLDGGDPYEPRPLRPPPEQLAAVRRFPIARLAAELHSGWMHQKEEQGWRFGPVASEEDRTLPSLVPFERLGANEQAQNCSTATEIVATILALGYQIVPPPENAPPADPDQPVDPQLIQLVEYLAENAHDAWAECKLQQGWRAGSARDDAAKVHPWLVHYCDLPDAAQDLDRNAAMNVISTLLDLGFKIEAPPAAMPPPSPSPLTSAT